MDVVFVQDTTGSMGPILDNIKSQMPSIIAAITTASGGDYQLGLINFENNVTVDVDLAPKNADKITTAFNAFTSGGGGNEPEASNEAIKTAVENRKASDLPSTMTFLTPPPYQVGDFSGHWRPEATKVIILITDARPAGFDDVYVDGKTDVSAAALATEAGTRNMHISAIFVPDAAAVSFGFIPTIQRIMKAYATNSRGIYVEAKADGSGTAAAINEVIAGCGGGAEIGGNSLVLDPTELFMQNGDTANVSVTNFAPPPAGETTVFTADGLPDDSTVTFVDRTPDIALTEAKTMRVTIGPDTLSGTYVLGVTASQSAGSAFNYVLVFVDCQAPYLLGTTDLGTQSQSVPSGSTAKLSVVPGGNGPFKYQWYQGHSGSTAFPISGATTSTLTTGAITTPTDFWVRINNACGTRDSATATITPR
jgi:hypothetical protein